MQEFNNKIKSKNLKIIHFNDAENLESNQYGEGGGSKFIT